MRLIVVQAWFFFFQAWKIVHIQNKGTSFNIILILERVCYVQDYILLFFKYFFFLRIFVYCLTSL